MLTFISFDSSSARLITMDVVSPVGEFVFGNKNNSVLGGNILKTKRLSQREI